MDRMSMQRRLLGVARIGADPSDSDDARLEKSLLVLSSLMMACMGVGWGVVYAALGAPLAAAIPLAYAVFSFTSLAIFSRTRRYDFFRTSQLCASLLLPFLLLIALGGFANSSAVVLWSLTSPLGALVFAGRRQAVRWFLAYLALVAASAVWSAFSATPAALPPIAVTIFFALNISGVSVVVFVLLEYFVAQKDTSLYLLGVERRKSEALLLNILPREIADILKNENRIVADYYDGASILFADVVNFTPLSANMTPTELVTLLDDVFSAFDGMVERLGVEKIKTIGDCYMVAAGIPTRRDDHAQALARLALEMRDYVSQHEFLGRHLVFRIGLNSGPVVAGVIGRKKFSYDLWGDAVNTASRMESHGQAGIIQLTAATHALIHDDFVCEPAGTIAVKGKGMMEVWHLIGARP